MVHHPAAAPFLSFDFSIHDLHAAILAAKRISRVLQLRHAVADGDEVLGRQTEFFDEKAPNRVGAPFRKSLIIGAAALGVGMASEKKGGAFQFSGGDRPPQSDA